MKLKLGFVGLGAMGFSHLRMFHEGCAGEAEAVSICGRDRGRIERALEVAPKARVYADPVELIRGDAEAVVISTPNFMHAPLGLEAVRAGKHLYLEKPIGISQAECDRFLEAASGSNRVILIGHELRYSPFFQRLKAMIDAGDIGVPRVAWCRELRGPFQKKSENWILDARRSGGTLVDKNCHHFDLMNWWLGARPWRVCAFGGKATGSGVAGAHQVADHAVVIFEYRSGARGSLDLCLFAPETGDRGLTMGVAGSEGFLRTRLATLEIQWWRRGEKESRRIQVQAPRGEGWGGHLGFQEIHREFLRAVQEGNPPLTSPAACADGTRLAIAAEESISSGRVVEIV